MRASGKDVRIIIFRVGPLVNQLGEIFFASSL